MNVRLKTGSVRRFERGLVGILLTAFLWVEWGPLSDERARWGIARGQPFVKEIALTFDDGPREEGIYELLAALRESRVPGTFFLVGEVVRQNTSITRDMADAGHEIENHSFTHPKLYTLDQEKVVNELTLCNKSIESLNIKPPRFLRPPGGGYGLEIFHALRRANMRLGLWNANTADYTGKPASEIVRCVTRSVRPGSIVLMHSGVPATVEALPEIAANLRARGYRFVTLQDLWNGGAI